MYLSQLLVCDKLIFFSHKLITKWTLTTGSTILQCKQRYQIEIVKLFSNQVVEINQLQIDTYGPGHLKYSNIECFNPFTVVYTCAICRLLHFQTAYINLNVGKKTGRVLNRYNPDETIYSASHPYLSCLPKDQYCCPH